MGTIPRIASGTVRLVVGTVLLVAVLVSVTLVGGAPPATASGRPTVVVGESSWGSIVSQLAGNRATVTSIVTNPATDPHDYEPRASDGRRVAGARYVVLNGAGYDPWLRHLVDAERSSSRRVLDIGDLLHLRAGDNPHQWYDPDAVAVVAARVADDLTAIDPTHGAYFRDRLTTFLTDGLAEYHALIEQIRREHGGAPIGASESIVAPLAHALHLDLATPASFLDAISEGTDPSAKDRVTIERQIARREIRVFVYNSQNATRDVRALVAKARAAHIPVTTVTETLQPAKTTFQAWQVAQLRSLLRALGRAAA